jgi:hypothetical protein
VHRSKTFDRNIRLIDENTPEDCTPDFRAIAQLGKERGLFHAKTRIAVLAVSLENTWRRHKRKLWLFRHGIITGRNFKYRFPVMRRAGRLTAGASHEFDRKQTVCGHDESKERSF